jgi:hypothetical protein
VPLVEKIRGAFRRRRLTDKDLSNRAASARARDEMADNRASQSSVGFGTLIQSKDAGKHRS